MYSFLRGYLFKLLVSISIIGFIASRIEWLTFVETINNAHIPLLTTAFVLLWVERGWAVFKWQYLLRAQKSNIALWPLFCIYNIGAFWGLFLPSSLSTDVVRGYYLSRQTANLELSASSVIVDRMMGLFSLLFCCLMSVLIYSSTFSSEVFQSVLLFSTACLLVSLAAFWQGVSNYLERHIPFFTRSPMGKKIIGMHRAFLRFKQYPLVMFTSFVYSLILQVIRVVTIYITALAFGVEAELVTFFIVVPITVIIIMIPVSIGGLGVREGSFVSMFSLVGLHVNESFALSGTNSIMVTIIGLCGGIFYMFAKLKTGEQPASTDVSYSKK